MKESAKASIDLISKWLQFQVYKRQMPGLSVGICVEGETVLLKSFGYKNLETKEPATPDTLYRVASHSKLFTASAIMKLFSQGKLRLDDPVCEHLDWFRSGTDPNMAHVTIRHLLSHSSGMNRDGITAHWYNDKFPDKAAIQAQAMEGLSSFEVGEHWKYSNVGYTLLGQVIEAVTGKSFEEAVAELVLVPMGLENTRPDFDEATLPLHATGYGRTYPGRPASAIDHIHANVMNSATGFSSSVSDMLAFYQFHMLGNEEYLADRDKREMQRVQFLEKDYSWGLGWSVEKAGDVNLIGHGGVYPGFLTNSIMEPKSKTIIVLMSNSLDAVPSEFCRGIFDFLQFAFKNKEDLQADDKDDPALCDDISGHYETRWGITQFGRLDGKLVEITPELLSPAPMASRYTSLGDNRFKLTHGRHNGRFGEDMEAVRNPQTGEINLVMGENVLEPFKLPD